MNTGVGYARSGQWYARWDKGELFLVTRYDLQVGVSSMEPFDGDLYELDDYTWMKLPLSMAEPPRGWSVHKDVTSDEDFEAEAVAAARSEKRFAAGEPARSTTATWSTRKRFLLDD